MLALVEGAEAVARCRGGIYGVGGGLAYSAPCAPSPIPARASTSLYLEVIGGHAKTEFCASEGLFSGL